MYVVINTTSPPFAADNNLSNSCARQQKSLKRLSSGVRIVSPANDADGLAVAMKLLAARRRGVVAVAIGNAGSLLETQDGALKVMGALLERMKVRRPRSSGSNKMLSA